MKVAFDKRCLLAFLSLCLTGCIGGGYSLEAHNKAKEQFNIPSNRITYSKNASFLFMSIAQKIEIFPDNEQSVDAFCREGLPAKYSHFKNWFEKHSEALILTNEALKKEKYLLNAEALTDPKRPDVLNSLGRLLLLNAVLHEKEGRVDEAYQAILNVYRFVALISQDAMSDDYYLAWNIHRKADMMLARYLKKLTDKELKEVVLFLEAFNRTMNPLEVYLDRKKQSAALTIQQYLAPTDEDGFFESFFGMSAKSLEEGVEEVQSLQAALLKKPAVEIFDKKQWSGIIEMISSKSTDDIFFTFFFGWQPRNNVISLQRIHYFVSAIQTNNELRQIQAQWVLERRAKPQANPDLEELQKKIFQSHKVLKEAPRAERFKDRFSGKAYGFRKEKVYNLVWSIGPDLKDTDGLFPLNMEKGEGDIVLKLR